MEGQTVWIKNADEGNRCFPDTIPVQISGSLGEDGALSGEPVFSQECPQNELGHLWPYIVELYVEGELVASTDPGGIFH